MNQEFEKHKFEVLATLSLNSLRILIAADFLIGIMGYYIYSSNIVFLSDYSTIVQKLIFILAFGEIGILYFLKNRLFSKIPKIDKDMALPLDELKKISFLIITICASISFYGMLLIIFGAEFRLMMFFIALSLLVYQILRIRAKDLSNLQS